MESTLKRLNVNLEGLYKQEYQICAKVGSYTFSVILVGRDSEPDCKISSFSANIYFRTRNGQNRKKYNSVQSLDKAIKNAIRKNYSSTDTIVYILTTDISII